MREMWNFGGGGYAIEGELSHRKKGTTHKMIEDGTP